MVNPKTSWVAARGGVICGVFSTRREAVVWLKALLAQTLKDFDKQDKSDEFDYPIEIKGLEIKRIQTRETFLGL